MRHSRDSKGSEEERIVRQLGAHTPDEHWNVMLLAMQRRRGEIRAHRLPRQP